LSGFPIFLPYGFADTYPVIGDVDGDGQLEIVVAGTVTSEYPWHAGVRIFSANGTLERTITGSGSGGYGTAPALADLDGDGVPDIILQTETTLHAWRGDGTSLPGWPVNLGTGLWLENQAPVVGDLDGDLRPDVVVLKTQSSNNIGDILALRYDGTTLPGFPKRLNGLGGGAAPAIADIDLDGRNELIVASDYWDGAAGYFDKVWVYDLGGPTPHGPVEWGQFMGGPRHRGLYQPVPVTPAFQVAVERVGAGAGAVTSDPPGIACGTDCSERYYTGSSVTLTAEAGGGSAFAGWGGVCAGQGTTCTFVVGANDTITADFGVGYRLEVSRTGSGTGSIVSSPAGIDCGADCAETYLAGASVTLTATPAANSVFTGWDGACSGQGNPCTITLSADSSVSAGFGLVHRLDVSLTGGGSGAVASSPAGIDCGADCSETYPAGTSVTLTATPAADSIFTGWGGACSGQGNPCTITPSSDVSVSADFALLRRLDVIRTGAGSGVVASSPAGIDCGADCSETYLAGTSVTLIATPTTGSVFTGWDGACSGQGNPCTITLSADSSASAAFALVHRLDVSRTGAGSGVVASSPAGIDCGVDCSETYLAGTSVTLTATPGAGSVFTGWGGACSGQASPCTLGMSGDQNVTAQFTPLFVLDVGRTGAGDGSVSSSPAGIACGSDCSEPYVAGTTVTLTASASAGSTFVAWDGACSGQGSTCVVAMDGPRAANARFEPVVTLSVARVGPGSGSVSSQPAGIACGADCSEDYALGSVVVLTATPAAGSRFQRWEGACTGTAPTCSVTMDASKSVRARFVR
jgi:hypothetical protein